MASREETFTAKILINDSEATSKLQKMEQQLEAVKKRRDEALQHGKIDVWKAANKEVDKLEKAVGKQKQQIIGLDNALRNMSTANQKELEQVVKSINKELSSGHIRRGSKEWEELNATLRRTKEQLREIREEGQEQPSVWGRFFKFLNDSWGGLVIVFQTITGMSQTIRNAVQSYAEMEEEMANVRKYTGLTDEIVQELNEDFKNIDTRTSREQLNQLAGAAGRLGIQSKEQILEFVKAADMIGVALGDDLGDGAVDKIGKLAMAFGEDERMGLQKAMLSTGSALNELAQNSSAQAGYLVEFTARVAGFGKQLGLTQAEIMGFGTVMDENLLKDEMAATAFGNMLTKMQTDTATFARIAGKSVEEFTRMLREDANSAVLAVADSLKRQDPTTMMKMLDDMGLDGSRAVGVLSTLADKIDDVRKHQQRATEAYERGTSVVDEFGTMNNTVQAQLEKCKKEFREMTLELGEKLLPVVKYTISGAGLLTKGLGALLEIFGKYKGTIIGTTTALAVLTLHRKADIIQSKLQVLWNERILKSLKAIDTFIKRNKWGAVITVMAALVGYVADLTRKTDKLTGSQNALRNATREAEEEIAEERVELMALVGTAMDKAVADDTRREALRKLQEKYPGYLDNLSIEELNTQKASDAIRDLTDSLLAEAKARILVQKIMEAEQEKQELSEGWFSGVSGFLSSVWNTMEAIGNTFWDTIERSLNAVKGLPAYGDFGGWNEPTWIEEHGYSTDAAQIGFNKWASAVAEVDERIRMLNTDLEETLRKREEITARRHNTNEHDDGGDDSTPPYRPQKELDKELSEIEKRRKVLAEEAKALYQAQIAEEMMLYRKGERSYTEYMDNRHRITQNYYEQMKNVYGEDSAEYRKMLDDREREEMQYYQWKAKLDEQQLTMDRIQRENSIRRQYMQQQVVDTEAMNEALFESEVTYMRQRQNLHQNGSKEWLEMEMQIQSRELQHQFELEQQWLQKLSLYREQTGMMDYQIMMELEMRGARDFYAALLNAGQMTQQEYDAIIEHIRRKYIELAAQQKANNDIQKRAAKGLETAKENAGVKEGEAGNDAATGIFSISQAVSQQKLVNEQLKLLYGEDYENNREYQEAKRQLDAETMQQVVAGAQAAYSTISTLMSAASSYAKACSDLEVAKITANYDRQIEAAGNNSKKREKLEKERDKKIAEAKTKANKKAMAMEIAQAIAQTAMGAISAYSSTMAGAPYPANLVLAPISAGIALAAGTLQIATIKKQHEAEAAGYYEGGFTGGHRYRKEAGVVHEGEFVANHQAVNNRQLMPVFSLIDQAQRSNRVASLRAEDVTNVMGGPASQAIVPVVNVQAPDNSELSDTLEKVCETQDRLAYQLEQGIGVDIPIDGENGMYRKIKIYENLLNNK